MTTRLAVAIAASYLLGAIPTSYWVVKLVRGRDLRATGSGNLGATNLFRLLGWKFALPVGLFDLMKGAIPVVLIAPWAGLGHLGGVLLGMTAVLGHVFSVFVRFQGGKGVATGGGIILGLAPIAFLVAFAVWIITVRLTGYVSLGSILAAVALEPALWFLEPQRRDVLPWVAGMAVAVIWFHRANIRRLLDGTESNFRSQPARTVTEAR